MRNLSFIFIILFVGCNLPASRQNLDGRRNFEVGNYNQALKSFQQALNADPANADAHYNIGRTLHHLANGSKNKVQLQHAEKAYRTALGLNPAHQPSYRGLSVLLTENQRAPEAFALLQNWSRIQPNSAEPKIELARMYAERGERATAVQVLSDALVVDNENERALRAMGTLREQSGELAQAVNNYQRSLQINPMQPELANRLAQIQLRTGVVPISAPPASRTASVPDFPRF